MRLPNICLLLVFILFIHHSESRKHELSLKNEHRKYFALSKFGFYKEGTLEISVKNLSINPFDIGNHVGFTLSKTLSDSISPNLDSYQDNCYLEDEKTISVLYLKFDFEKKKLTARCTSDLNALAIKVNSEKIDHKIATSEDERSKRDVYDDPMSDSSLLLRRRKRKADETQKTTPVTTEKPNTLNTCQEWNIPLSMTAGAKPSFSTDFTLYITSGELQGLYSLYFHNCGGNKKVTKIGPSYPAVNISLTIIENNNGNFLSAGQMPLPALYFCMACVFFVSGCIWLSVIRRSKENAFKIHYIMGILVFVKSLSLIFHGINYYYIQKDGYHIEAWAVLYYITHLLKGALLFITIVLIGTGWAFIKHILSDKDKKIFMVVIPLQVLANVAEIIMTESEEGELQHTTWREVFIMVDLLCCGAILFPVVWSIRHLQEASQTDGKAAISLAKLKLFRHFYIMIVCYIYFTRIIVYLLRITVPFQWEWLDELFREIATFGFFTLTGYKFQPASNNPYFLLSQEENEDDLEMDAVVTESGFMENITKVNQRQSNDDDENSGGTTKRESSHEYD